MAKKLSNSDLFDSNLFIEPRIQAEEFLKVIKEIGKTTTASVKEQAKVLQQFSKISGLDELRKIKAAIDKINNSTNEMLKLQNEERRLKQSLSEETLKQTKANEKLKAQINAQNKAIREQIKNEQALLIIQNKEVKSIQDLQTRNNALVRTRKNLDLTTKQGTAEYKKLTAEINRNNTALKQHDAAIGNYQRNVGNYGQALKGFGTQLLGILGAGSFLSVVKNAVDINAKFGQSMADLKAITGATDEQMKFFEETAINQAKGLDGSTASATEYVEALKLIASAKPELLENAAALNELTQSALVLADASGLELPDAATRLTDAMNQFGASSREADRYINVLAAGSQKGAVEIPELTEALLGFGAVAKSSNITIEESTALIEALGEKGLKGSEAGNKLKNILVKLSAAKGLSKEAQQGFANAGIDVNILSDKTLSLNDRLKELSKAQDDEVALLKIFGAENIVAAKTLLGQVDRVDQLKDSITGTNTAYEQQEERNKSLSAELKKLGNAWESSMIGFGRGGGELSRVIRFIRENLDTIIVTIVKLVKAFAVFKTAQTLFKAGEIGAKAYSSAISLFAKNTEGATKSFKALDSSMKANVIGLVALAVYELADALDIFGDKAAALEQERKKARVEALQESVKSTIDSASEKLRIIDDTNKVELSKLAEGSKERAVFEQKIRDEKINSLKFEINKRNDLLAIDNKKQLAVLEKATEEKLKKDGLLKKGQSFERTDATQFANETKDVRDSIKQEIEGIQSLLDELTVEENENINSVTSTVKTQSLAQLKEREKKIEDSKKLELEFKRWLEDLNAENITNEREQDVEKEKLSFERAKEGLIAKFETLGKLTKEQEAQKLAIEEALLLDHNQKLDEINKKHDKTELDDTIKSLDLEYKIREEYLLRTEKDQEKLDAKLLQLSIDKAKDELTILEGNAAAQEEIINKQIELDNLLNTQRIKGQEKFNNAITKGVEGVKKAADDEKARLEDLKNAATELADEVANAFIDASKRREEQLDKEITNSEKRQDELRGMAERGVLEADQSLAAEERKQAELERKKIAEQKKQQRIELASTVFKSYAGHVDSNDKSPLSSTIRDITSLAAFIRSIPAFIEGTESVEKTLKPTLNTGQDDYLIRVDGKERILNPEQNKDLAGLSNDEVVRIVKESRSLKGHSAGAVQNVKISEAFNNSLRWQDNSQIIAKFDSLERAINNKPVQYIAIDKVTGAIVEQIKTSSKVFTTHYKKPNING